MTRLTHKAEADRRLSLPELHELMVTLNHPVQDTPMFQLALKVLQARLQMHILKATKRLREIRCRKCAGRNATGLPKSKGWKCNFLRVFCFIGKDLTH